MAMGRPWGLAVKYGFVGVSQTGSNKSLNYGECRLGTAREVERSHSIATVFICALMVILKSDG